MSITSWRNIKLWSAVVVISLLVRGLFFFSHLSSELDLTAKGDTLVVEPGMSLTIIANVLENEGVLVNAWDFLFYARLTGKADRIQAGEYSLNSGMSSLDLLDKLLDGDVVYHQLTILEGWSTMQALRAMQDEETLVNEIGAENLFELQSELSLDYFPEGLFFPDTYSFTMGTSDRDILLQANALLQEVLDEAWKGRDLGLPLESAYEALILASIIEKETAVASEYHQVAGVFIRRLQQNMRLQTDPTVIYGLGDDFNGNLSRANLRELTAYNTYRINGLPPTPIALPGRAAIFASVHPDESDSLYFVAKGDGSHYFSSTLEEHNAAVQRYQIDNRAENYRSSPQSN